MAREFVPLLQPGGRVAELLDQDEIRRGLGSGLGLGRAARETRAGRVTFVAEESSRNSSISIVTRLSPSIVEDSSPNGNRSIRGGLRLNSARVL